MIPRVDGGERSAPIDRPVLTFLLRRLRATPQVATATMTDASGHLELRIEFAPAYYPSAVDTARLTVRWYTNDDFALHYRETHTDDAWECRWDRHPNSHNTRDHFHPPPAAHTPGEDSDWPADYRDVVALVLDDIEDRIERLWS